MLPYQCIGIVAVVKTYANWRNLGLDAAGAMPYPARDALEE